VVVPVPGAGGTKLHRPNRTIGRLNGLAPLAILPLISHSVFQPDVCSFRDKNGRRHLRFN